MKASLDLRIGWKDELRSITRKNVLDFNQNKWPWYILNPENNSMEYWTKFNTLLLLYTAIVAPYRLSFISADEGGWVEIEYMISACFFLDFLVNCFLAYYDTEKNLVSEPKKILMNYLCGWMLLDLFASMPYSLIFNSGNHYNNIVRVVRLPRLIRLIKVVKLLRLVKIMKISRMSKHVHTILKFFAAFERFFWFIFLYFLLVHMVACLWVLVAKLETSSINWITVGGFDDYDDTSLYVVSLYWTVTTVTTVGYGDIVPVSWSEKFFACIFMTIGILFYSYTISSLTNLMSSVDFRKSKLNQQLYVLNGIAAKHKMSSNFYFQISQALEYISTKSSNDIDELLNDLPIALSNKLLVTVYEKQVANNVFFESKSTEFVAWVANKLKFLKCKSGTIIYHEEEYANQMYFIINGKIDFIIGDEKSSISYLELEKDYYFGELDLLFSETKTRLHTAQAVIDCELLCFNKENFYLMLKTFEEESVEICMIAKNRLERIDKSLNEALFNVQNKLPVVRKKSFPMVPAVIPNMNGNLFDKNSTNLFKQILEKKYKFKEKRIKTIYKRATELEREAEEIKKLMDIIVIRVLDKYPKTRDMIPLLDWKEKINQNNK